MGRGGRNTYAVEIEERMNATGETRDQARAAVDAARRLYLRRLVAALVPGGVCSLGLTGNRHPELHR